MFLKDDKVINKSLVSFLNLGLKLIKSIDGTYYESYGEDKIIKFDSKDFLDSDKFFSKTFSLYNNTNHEFKNYILEKPSINDYHLYFNKYTNQNEIENLESKILDNLKSDKQLDIEKIKIFNFEKL